MATKSVEKELLNLENQYWQALKHKDSAAPRRMTNNPGIITGAHVGRVDKKALAAMVDAAPNAPEGFELKDAEVRMLRDDVAIVDYKVRKKLVVDGKPVTFEGSAWSTWVRRNGHWIWALHTESIHRDSFGRNRHATT